MKTKTEKTVFIRKCLFEPLLHCFWIVLVKASFQRSIHNQSSTLRVFLIKTKNNASLKTQMLNLLLTVNFTEN